MLILLACLCLLLLNLKLKLVSFCSFTICCLTVSVLIPELTDLLTVNLIVA